VCAGLLDRFSCRRAERPGHRSAQQPQRNHCHETDETSLAIVHPTQSLCYAHSVTVSRGLGRQKRKTDHSAKPSLLLIAPTGAGNSRPLQRLSLFTGCVQVVDTGAIWLPITLRFGYHYL
jgi:hypothetical protein